MDNNVKYYAVLMQRTTIDSGVYLFKPMSLIEGRIICNSFDSEELGIDMDNIDIVEQRIFTDSTGGSYLFAGDPMSLDVDSELSVAFEVSEIDLKEKYPNITLNEAKTEYYDHICSVSYIGFYSIAHDKIILTSFDFLQLSDQLSQGNLNFDMSKVSNDKGVSCQEKDNTEENFIVIDVSKFEEILKSKSFEEMKGKLEDIYHVIDLNNETFSDMIKRVSNSSISGNDIVNISLLCYEEIVADNDLTNIQNRIHALIEFYIRCTLELDDKEKFGDAHIYQDFLYNLVDKVQYLLKTDDIDVIKSMVEALKQQEQENILSVAKAFNKCAIITHDEKKRELESIFEAKTDELNTNLLKIDVNKMKDYLDERIIGQEQAKRDVIQALIMNELSSDSRDRSSCLLVGPTGSGKTLIAEAVSEYLDKPIEIIDTTQLTMPGYIGMNIDDFLSRLLVKTNGDLDKAERAIVVFDEIDKKGSDSNGDVSGKGVLNTLLPFMQGTTYDIKYNGRMMHFDTSKLTIFATGAFTDVAREKNEKNYGNGNIGFNTSSDNSFNKEDISYEKLSIDDLAKYGKMPIELIGRFTCITQLSGHTKDSLRKILTESKVSALLNEQEKLNKIDIELRWTEGFIDNLVTEALKKKTGARSLKATLEECINQARWEVLCNMGKYRAILLTEKTVYNTLDCTLVDMDGNDRKLYDIINGRELKKEPAMVLVKK